MIRPSDPLVFVSRFFFASLLLLWYLHLVPAAGAELAELPSFEFEQPEAPALSLPGPLAEQLRSRDFVSGVSIAFDQVAVPQSGVDASSLSFTYDPRKPDGVRFSIELGETIVLPLFDWVLVPTVKFADSGACACFTRAGRLSNQPDQDRMSNIKGWVYNYHPAFHNTLLGWRLLQADALLADSEGWKLPMVNGASVFGPGERWLNPTAAQKARKDLGAIVSACQPGSQPHCQGIILCDHQQEIQFSIKDKMLKMTGEPVFYCWDVTSAGGEAVPVEAAAKKLQDKAETIRLLNPQAWDAMTKVMHYSAFFRYCKLLNPEKWAEVMTAINGVAMPVVANPTAARRHP